MKQIPCWSFLLLLGISLSSCDKNPEELKNVFIYSANIQSPNNDDKNVDDELDINISFVSGNDEAVHHVKVRIYNKDDQTEVYNKPTGAHVHESDGKYDFTDSFNLSNENGITAHTDWILEAKVWGHGNETGEVIDMIEFHVHP